jgi:hypothetical protein
MAAEQPSSGASFEGNMRIPDMARFSMQPAGPRPGSPDRPGADPAPQQEAPTPEAPAASKMTAGEAAAAFAKLDVFSARLKDGSYNPLADATSSAPTELLEPRNAVGTGEDVAAIPPTEMSDAELAARATFAEYQARGQEWADNIEATGRYMLYAPPMPEAALDLAGVADRSEQYTSLQFLDNRGPGHEREVENGQNLQFKSPMYQDLVAALQKRSRAQGGDTSDYLLVGDTTKHGDKDVVRYIYLQWRGPVQDSYLPRSEEVDDPGRAIEWQFALPIEQARSFHSAIGTPDVLRQAFMQSFAPIVLPEDGLEIRPGQELTLINEATYGNPHMIPAEDDVQRRLDNPIDELPYVFGLDVGASVQA